ncbi:NAD-dependent succinate-semialdehyde dehydrogenase [Arthrobacter oryzae]|uniref:Succinate-semialdehyde dehydrogenase/glutarate-semialdehyde dehydrogenase n=1 Tax=Arthrobacter oryzae TaxID=409290 RepID=A0A495ESB7_9MICC|nr:NAD-dependent succinate-semialdehyde dehydrogenase [Arthrobacter oryzae]RKR19874.1 succinate-semialdehyde dehydrogenase/glutarate-semialdehyde dehydrogenase [Arthrobacter oryzae]
MTAYKTVNPATGETLKEFPVATAAEVEQALAASQEAFRAWRSGPVEDRAKVMARVAELYLERQDELARLISTEMGKPLAQSRGEVKLVADIFAYYATEGPGFLKDEPLNVRGGGEAVVRSAPVGPLLGIMPWNYPYYQVARFAAPNLVLGNTILLKHAGSCPQSALAIEQIFKDAGLPDGAYINLFLTNEQVADVIADDRLQGVSLTGSERAGSAVAEVAGRNLKKYVLELGGSDPFIVLDSEDLDATVKAAVGGRMGNAGQACTASKRFIVVEDLYEAFVEKFTARMAKIKPGDPLRSETTFGPLSSQSAADGLVEQIQDAVDKGANLRTGGHHVDGPGAFVEPTVLTDVTPDMRAFSEELFGPAAVIYKVANAAEAVELANGSPYGLGGSVFSADVAKAQEIADQLDTGMVFINSVAQTQADMPFGGVKRSGVGRELGRFGMDEFVNKKLIRTPR